MNYVIMMCEDIERPFVFYIGIGAAATSKTEGEALENTLQLNAEFLEPFTPLGYFFLAEPPVKRLPIPHYRTTDDLHAANPRPDLLETVQTMERRQEWMREYLINHGHVPLDFVGIGRTTENPKKVAREIREELGLVNGWAATCRTWQEALRMLIEKIELVPHLICKSFSPLTMLMKRHAIM